MFGITMYLMRLSDWLADREHRQRMHCNLCDQRFDTYADLERHKRGSHTAAQAG